MEGRSFSELYRNTSEEMFIKTMMEGTIGMPAPTMEMLGFKNLTQSFRTDSEELFKSWLTNGENNGCHSAAIGHRPRQASRRISADLSGLANRPAGTAVHNKPNDDIPVLLPSSAVVEPCNDPSSNRNVVEKELQATNMFLAKAWFHSSQPMTRSRSSELRRRYVAMQNSQTTFGMEAMNAMNAAGSGNGLNNFKQDSLNASGFSNNALQEIPNQYNTFMSPSNSSSTTFNNPQLGNVDKISSVVSMLKGTLERKKLNSQVENEAVGDSSFAYNAATSNQGQGFNVHENQGMYQDLTTMGVRDNGMLQAIEESLMEGIMGPVNPKKMNTMSQEPSQSESSTAPPVVSNCFVDMFDEPCVSIQAPSVCESSRNQIGDGRSPEDCFRSKDFRERIYDNTKEEQKPKTLIRYGSVTSTGSGDRGDPTKKRRVERSRKMAEAKERSSTPVIPSDMQSILKRCENLEKEVRSLKLNLAFMNRKDSEQTKQIEELQKQNDDLGDEKERLLEEIERIISETGKM